MSEPELDPPFDLHEPVDFDSPLAFCSPHSGRVYPRAFIEASRLDPKTLRRSEDAYVDDLLAEVRQSGSPLLAARFPRAFLDVNREPYELDPRMFEGRLPGFANTRSLRVAGGLGTIARIVCESQEIYARRLGIEEALARIESLYKPFHAALARLLARLQRQFGVAVLIDTHSMPSSSLARDDRSKAYPSGTHPSGTYPSGPHPSRAHPAQADSSRADIVLGDRFGTSAASVVVDTIEEAFTGLGYAVARNKPYAGGFITEHYGHPSAGVHVVQIEINRALYMDEATLTRLPAFERLAQDIRAVRDEVAGLPLSLLSPFSAAAE